MQRLLYHAPDNPSQESPFDRAIVQVVQDQAASIVSPYIGLQYLHRLIGLSRSWRLISDVLEWLSATPPKERIAVYEFLKKHEGMVHHYPAIHAKTVVSLVGAYTGSANLTDAGVLRRTEFGVLLTDADQVREIQQWFDAIWAETSPPPLQGVLELIDELNQISHIAAEFGHVQTTPLESDARRVRAKLVNILGHEPQKAAARPTSPIGTAQAHPAPVQAPTSTVSMVAPSIQAPVSELALPSPPSTSPTTPTAPAATGTFDLEEEIAAFVASNAKGGFTFADLHHTMRRKWPRLSMQLTYQMILDSCASHPRALFSADAMNRLVYREGRFVQSNRDLLTHALKPLDEMVSRIIEHLSFEEAVASQEDLESQIAPLRVLRLLLEGMVRSGFVVQMGAGLKLVPTAIWSPRLKLLERAHAKWSVRLNAHSTRRAAVLTAQVESSQVPVDPLHAAAQSLDIEHVDDEGQSQEELISRRSAQLDTVFSYLAEMRAKNGEKTKIGLSYLKTQLMEMSGLSESDVSRLINGTFHMYRSPFLAFVTEARGTVSIVADLEANPHLEALPNTRAAIKNYTVLQALEAPARPQHIPLEEDAEIKPAMTRIDRLKDVDRAYLQIAQWIFQNNPSTVPMKEGTLIMVLSASGISRDVLRRLLLDTGFRFPRLFSLQAAPPGEKGSRYPTLRLLHDKLLHYPKTSSFLKTVVWPSGSKHAWLPTPAPARAAPFVNVEQVTLNELTRKSSERDKNYARLIAYIDKRVLRFDRFKNNDALVSFLHGTGIENFVINFLLGIGHKPPTQLMRVEKDAYGLFVQINPGALDSYPRSRKLVDKPLPEGTYRHPWLTNSASFAARPVTAPAPALHEPKRSAPPAFAPLVWDNGTRFEIDTLYVALLRMFVERADAGQLTAEQSAQLREASVTKYLKICELRKSSGNTHEPVLSLEIHDGAEKQVELVIYRGYRAYIHQYPKLQRYLTKTPMNLREV